MVRLFFLCLLIFFGQTQLNAQARNNIVRPTYKTAIGIRTFPIGVNVKTNLDTRRAALEFIGYFRKGFAGLALYEWHMDLNQTRNLRFYFGGGGLVAFKNADSGGGAALGVAGVVGLDYKFLKLPLNIALDWQPSYQVGNVDEFEYYGGLAVRFAF